MFLESPQQSCHTLKNMIIFCIFCRFCFFFKCHRLHIGSDGVAYHAVAVPYQSVNIAVQIEWHSLRYVIKDTFESVLKFRWKAAYLQHIESIPCDPTC